ncbi:MAG: hypothetical protein NE334_19365 [Lentisphaeraceae bacterium]|nr:hypothetical protein [Lentisphaeraceae bacterium]
MSGKLIIRLIFILGFGAGLYYNSHSLKQHEFHVKNTQIVADLPPTLQVTSVALGPMKGLLADVIWWRAERMQANKEFFESLQLSEWMTALQPTYPSVWGYQGFNLAFNISYNFSNSDERWRWVLAGIELMRDKGLRYIPDWEQNRSIRFEIVNIFARKLSGVSDTESRRFQDLWTLEMLKYFDAGDRAELEEIVAAKNSITDLLADSDIQKLMSALGLNEEKFVEMVRLSPPNMSAMRPETPQNKAFNAAIRKIRRYDQKKKIVSKLNMSPEKILQVDKDFGPLDWRTHQAQIIYWGMEENQKNFESGGVNYSHYIRDAMLSSFYNGRIVFSEQKDYFMRTHNIEMLAKIHTYFDSALADLQYGTKEFRRVDRMNRDFLKKATVICYTYNQMDAAKDLFHHYEAYMEEDGISMTFEQFIIQGMNTSLNSTNYKTRRSFIESILAKAFESGAIGEWGKYHGYVKMATLIHRMHQKEFEGQPARLLPPLKEIFKTAKGSYAQKAKKSSKAVGELEEEAEKYKIPVKIDIGHE